MCSSDLGIAETITPLDPSAVVPPGDVEALADALTTRLLAPTDRSLVRAHAFKFDLAQTLVSYVEAFRASLRSDAQNR